MQPRKQTPSQSMLRRPAASAAVMPCAATATSDNRCSTLSLGGKLHIALFPSVSGAYALGSQRTGSRFPLRAQHATKALRRAEQNLASTGCPAAIIEENQSMAD